MDTNGSLYEAAETAWKDACLSAFMQLKVDSGKSLIQLAADFGVRESYLENVVAGRAAWSRQLVLRMAAATDQHPIRMLYREALGDAR